MLSPPVVASPVVVGATLPRCRSGCRATRRTLAGPAVPAGGGHRALAPGRAAVAQHVRVDRHVRRVVRVRLLDHPLDVGLRHRDLVERALAVHAAGDPLLGPPGGVLPHVVLTHVNHLAALGYPALRARGPSG